MIHLTLTREKEKEKEAKKIFIVVGLKYCKCISYFCFVSRVLQCWILCSQGYLKHSGCFTQSPSTNNLILYSPLQSHTPFVSSLHFPSFNAAQSISYPRGIHKFPSLHLKSCILPSVSEWGVFPSLKPRLFSIIKRLGLITVLYKFVQVSLR